MKPLDGDFFLLSTLSRQHEWIERGWLYQVEGGISVQQPSPYRRAKHIYAKSMLHKEISVVRRIEEPGRIT